MRVCECEGVCVWACGCVDVCGGGYDRVNTCEGVSDVPLSSFLTYVHVQHVYIYVHVHGVHTCMYMYIWGLDTLQCADHQNQLCALGIMERLTYCLQSSVYKV